MRQLIISVLIIVTASVISCKVIDTPKVRYSIYQTVFKKEFDEKTLSDYSFTVVESLYAPSLISGN